MNFLNSIFIVLIKRKEKRSLMKHFPALTDATINDILNELVEGDHFLKAQKELGTDHKRMDFIKKNFNFNFNKVIQIFFTLGEIPKHQRSKIDRLHLVAVVQKKVIKHFRYSRVYEEIVNDLKILEQGVNVYHPVERRIRCGLLLNSADNLEGK